MGLLSSLVKMVVGKVVDATKDELSGQYQRSEHYSQPVRPKEPKPQPARVEVEDLCRKVCDSDYISNLRIGRSWILPQLVEMGFDANGNFSKDSYIRAVKQMGFAYMWKVMIRNVKALQKLQTIDPEGYRKRARWWTKEVMLDVIRLDYSLVRSVPLGKTYTNCFGGPYVLVNSLLNGKGYCEKQYFFVNTPNPASRWNASNSKTLRDLFDVFRQRVEAVEKAQDPTSLYAAVLDYYNHRYLFRQDQLEYQTPDSFLRAFAGDGACSAMTTMVKHLGLTHHGDSGMMLTRDASLADIEVKADLYREDGLKLLDYCSLKYFNRSQGGTFDYRQYVRR